MLPTSRTESVSETTRLEAFSDGVFAIAVTLLVLEIRLPSLPDGASLGGALGSLWPSYIGYVISFVTIGIMWVNHHAMFKYIGRVDRWFLLVNVFFLLSISFVPFPTAVLAEHLREPESRRTAAVFYGGTFVVTAAAYNAVWWTAAWKERLLTASLNHEGVRTISRRYAMGVPGYLVATLLALVSVAASLAVHGLLAALFALPETKRQRELEGDLDVERA
jgi:uncharacterized membrane protein